MVPIRKPVKIKLTWDQCELATWVGTKRQQGATHKKHTRNMPEESEEEYTERHIQAAAAEMAAAQAYNVYWPPSLEPHGKAPDIGTNMQVKHSKNRYQELMVERDAVDEQFYVLVTGQMPDFVVVGHIKAKHAKQEGWFTDKGNGRPKQYFVPQKELTPPENALEACRRKHAGR